VSLVPVGAAGVVQALAKEEGLEALLGGLEGHARGIAGTAQVTDRLVLDAGTYTAVRSPERRSRAISTASRRSVLTLSPASWG